MSPLSTFAQGLPDLEPLVMERLFWPEPRKLAALHPEEPVAVAARTALASVLSRGLQPMDAYLAAYRRCDTAPAHALGHCAMGVSCVHQCPARGPADTAAPQWQVRATADAQL